tara:strand:- start:72 stop:467 length:396 start_codon:yes stop_codon:yes gene_type:complete
MIAYSTYCSKEKKHSKILLPILERYKSKRILAVYNSAKAKGVKFVIFSGKYGILEVEQNIDHYDHLLLASEVEKHSDMVVSQLKEKKITKIIFYTNSIEYDKNLKPYIDCISMASAKGEITLEIIELSFND